MFKPAYCATPADLRVYSDNSAAILIVDQGCCQIVSLDFFRSKEIATIRFKIGCHQSVC